MKDSSDIAREVADISLLSSSLAELVVLRELSCAVLEKLERNYRFIIGFNSSLILLGMFGLITPALSAFLHNASTVYVLSLIHISFPLYPGGSRQPELPGHGPSLPHPEPG